MFFIMKRMPMTFFTRWLMQKDCFVLRWNPLRCSTMQRFLAKNAACLLTISDSLVTGEELDADTRATAFCRDGRAGS